MEGFKKLPKMQSFKIGGSVKQQFEALEKKERKTEEKADTAQDKAMVKKGVRQHETALHKGEPKTELKLKCGGRTKKATGTVKKFKSGGEVTNVYEAKKKSGDKDNIKAVKQIKPTKAAAPSKAAVKAKDTGAKTTKASGDKDLIKKVADTSKKAAAPAAASKAKNTVAKFCGGKAVRKMAEGKSVRQPGATEAQQKFYDKNKAEADKKAAEKDYEIFGSRGDAARKGMEEGRMDALGNAYKKGGKAKVKKYADGGQVFSDEEKAWLGGADATDPFILARMRSALGDKKPAVQPQGNYIPNANPAMDNRDIGQTGGNIDDESKWGTVTQAQRDFNKNIPGAGMSTPAAAPSAPVRQVAPRRPVIEDESNRGVVTPEQQAFNKTIPGSGNYKYIDIPSNNPGLKQFNQDATSPAGNFWRWLTANHSQRYRKK